MKVLAWLPGNKDGAPVWYLHVHMMCEYGKGKGKVVPVLI